MKKRIVLVPKNNEDDWIIIFVLWKDNNGSICVHRFNNLSSYMLFDILFEENFDDLKKLEKKLKKLRGEYSALVLAGQQKSRKPTRRLLPKI